MAIPAEKLNQERRARDRRIVYPERDGKPMGETDRHVYCITNSISALAWHFAGRDDVYVAGNNFIYFEEGNPRACVSPDTYVVFGVPSGLRDTYFTWLNGDHLPGLVIEFTSRETKSEDYRRKKDLYEKFGVAEYFIFDPRAEYQMPRLRGFRLEEGVYVPMQTKGGRLWSEPLQLELVEQGECLRFFDPARGRFLPTTLEETQRADDEATRARFEAERARREAARAEQESARAEHEARARSEAEAEVARLRAEIEALRESRSRE
jgi:Uma2 family endonuclease